MLAQAAGHILPELERLRGGVTEEAEADQLDRALETAREIAEAAKERGVNAEDLKAKAKAAKKDN
jgi:type VI protein secretion system component VasF